MKCKRHDKTRGALSARPCLTEVMSSLRAQPELIYMTGCAASEFPTVDVAPIIDMMSTPQSCDFGTQTPTHFVEKNIDKDYEWNEWALRRRALNMAGRVLRTSSPPTLNRRTESAGQHLRSS